MSERLFACPGQVVALLTVIVERPQPTLSTKLVALTFTTPPCQWIPWFIGRGVGVATQGVAVGRGVGVLCNVVAVAVAPGSVVAVGSSALAVLVESAFVSELLAWRGGDAAEVTAQYAPPPPTISMPRSARAIRFLKRLPMRLMVGILSLLVDVWPVEA
jgi:hypothetical protein